MSSNKNSGTETADRKLIREAKEEAWHGRRQLRREMPNPSTEAKWQLATALADYRDLLSAYSTERALNTPWDERGVDVDAIEQIVNQVTTGSKSVNRRGNAQQPTTVPMVEKVEPQVLIRIGNELDEIAKELGFAPKADNPPEHGSADLHDLRGLIKVRGQGEALGTIPDVAKEDDDEDDEDGDAE